MNPQRYLWKYFFLMRFSFIVTYILNKIKTHGITMLNWEENMCVCVYVFLKWRISTHERRGLNYWSTWKKIPISKSINCVLIIFNAHFECLFCWNKNLFIERTSENECRRNSESQSHLNEFLFQQNKHSKCALNIMRTQFMLLEIGIFFQVLQ